MTLRSVKLLVAILVAVYVLGARGAHADKPPRIPVAFGKWTGPHAGTFKSALRNGVAKDCVVVRADKARVLIEGEVTGDKSFVVHVTLKSPKTNDIVESREFTFAKADVSSAKARKMGHDVAEMARRAPE